MSADTVTDNELAEFEQRCRSFLDEHASGFPSDGEPDPRSVKRMAVTKKFQQALAVGLRRHSLERHCVIHVACLVWAGCQWPERHFERPSAGRALCGRGARVPREAAG